MFLNCGVGEDSRVPWTARRSNQSILKEISPGCSLEGLILKLKLQYFGHLMRRAHLKRPWGWERLKARGKGDDRGLDGWMASPTQWTWVWINFGSWWWIGRLECCSPWGCQESNMTEWLNRTELNNLHLWYSVVVYSLSRIWLFRDPVDCSPPGSYIYRTSQARIL